MRTTLSRPALFTVLALSGCTLATLSGCCKLLALCTDGECSTPDQAHADWSHYGGEIDAHALTQVAPGDLSGAEGQVKVEATISDVCAVKGCWMKVKGDDGTEMLVRFKDYGFFVPRNATGRRVWFTGHAQRVELSVDALRHLAEDAGKSPAEVAAISKPETQVTFTADAVWVQGPGLQDPYRPIGQETCEPVDSGTKPAG